MKTKSYNKLPKPLADFALSLCACSAASAFAMATGPSGIVGVVSGFLDAACPMVGVAPPDAAICTAALLAATSLTVSVYIVAHGYRSFHNGVWVGEKPSASKAYGSARIVSKPGALKRRFPVWRAGTSPKAGLVVGGIGSGKTTSCLAPHPSRAHRGRMLDPGARPEGRAVLSHRAPRAGKRGEGRLRRLLRRAHV